MKKVAGCFLFSVLCTVSGHTQTQIYMRDSLKQALGKEMMDTTRVSTLCQLSYQYGTYRPDSSMMIASEAFLLATKIGFKKGEALSLNRIGAAYRFVGNYPRAMATLFQSLQINEKIKNEEGIESNCINIGLVYYSQGDYRQALDYSFRAKNISEKLANPKRLAAALLNIGWYYYYLTIFDSASVYINQGYELSQKYGLHSFIARSLELTGLIYAERGQMDLALQYYRSAMPHALKAQDMEEQISLLLNMARFFEKSGRADSSIYYGRLSIAAAQQNGFIKQAMEADTLISHLFEKRKTFDSAFIYQKRAIAANDSLFSQEKMRQIEGLSFEEKLRQQEIVSANSKAEQDRNHNLQYAAIAIGLITFIMLFLALSRSIIVKEKFIEFFGILGLLAVFEFINLFIHPYLAHTTGDSPVLMLFILIAIGALLVPLHHRLENWMTNVMVEKNKKIRLNAAKKTIAKLEGGINFKI